jgi:hypothetical protein
LLLYWRLAALSAVQHMVLGFWTFIKDPQRYLLEKIWRIFLGFIYLFEFWCLFPCCLFAHVEGNWSEFCTQHWIPRYSWLLWWLPTNWSSVFREILYVSLVHLTFDNLFLAYVCFNYSRLFLTL